MEDGTPRPRPKRTLTLIGIVVTAAYLMGVVLYASIYWQSLLALPPNDVADFVAGSFAPLAFLWLVLGYMQQGEELRYSADALWLQGRELTQSVEQQRELVNVTRDQLELEQTARKQAEEDADRAAKPLLILRSQGHSRSAGAYSFNFELQNVGGPLFDVRLSYEGIEKPGERIPTFDIKKITIDFAPPEHPSDVVIVLRFLDIKGRPGVARLPLKARKRDDGFYQLTVVDEEEG